MASSINASTAGVGGVITTADNTGILNIQTAGTTAITINASQNVGIGVTPSAWNSGTKVIENESGALFSIGTNSLRIYQNAYYNSAGNNVYETTSNASAYIQTSGQHQFFNAPSGTAGANATFTQAMTLDASGNLGIGVTPSAWGSTYKAVQVGIGSSFTGMTNDVNLNLANNARFDGTNWIYLANSPAERYRIWNGQHQWFTSASGTAGNTISFTQAMTLDASGNLGIGKAAPTAPLSFADAAGTAGTTNKISLFFAAGEALGLYGFGVSAGQLDYVTGNAHVFYSKASNISTERMRINSAGNISLQGATTTATGIGITFPATQSASTDVNCLDDYEEGTWTPTFASFTGGYAVRVGTYTKIGNVVTVSCHLQTSGIGSSGGSGIIISGFPFVTQNTANLYAVSSSIHGTSWATPRTSTNILIPPNSTLANNMYFGMAAGASGFTVNYSDIGATGNLLFSITYLTT